MRIWNAALMMLWFLGLGHLAFSLDGAGTTENDVQAIPVVNVQDPAKSAGNPILEEPAQGTNGKTWFGFGYDQRFRHESWNNIQDQNSLTNDERHWNTFRQRLWFNAYLGTPNIEFYVRMLNQFTKTTTPPVPLNLDEVIFDNLYLNFKKTIIPGVSLKVGRQDISFGEGFIIMESSGLDGPRTLYFNAIDITYAHKKSKLHLIGILNPRQDRFLPIIHNQHKNLNEADQQAAGVYYTDSNHKNTSYELYYFLKKEIHDYRAQTNAQFRPDRHVNTIGARVVQRLSHEYTATGEFTLQRGRQHPDAQIQAWGGYGYLKKQFKAKYNPYILGGYWALSGDDPSTSNRVEGWDPLFERWPKWSGMYVWSLVPEKGVAYWTNLKMLQAEAGFTPWKPLTLKAILYLNNAFHPYTAGNPAIFANGKRRAVMPQFIAAYNFSNSIVGELRYEILAPGDFYTGRTTGQFLRFEINYSWKHPIGR
jgi:hypothetical protein